MTSIALIAALDRDRAIGRGNDLPWRLPDDLKRFKALTLGAPLLMGRRTAESLGRALPGRQNLVLTRRGIAPYAGMEPVASVSEALLRAASAPRLWVIGGAEVYALCLPLADTLHLTEIDTRTAGADAFFPAWPSGRWREVARSYHPADARHVLAFDFVDYERAAD